MSSPRVSVVVPADNAPKFLHEALISVIAQSSQDFELIVVDDGSDEDLSEAVEPCRALGERFVYLRQEKAGTAAARNLGIAESRGEWIAFLDHGDCWLPDKLTRQLGSIQSNDVVGMVFCQYRKFGKRRGGESCPERSPSGWLLPELLRHPLIQTLSTVMIRRSVIPEPSWFREDLTLANDIELYYRIAERAQIKFLPRILVEMRLHDDDDASSDLLGLHRESIVIANELAKRLGDEVSPEVAKLIEARICCHLMGLAKAARHAGDRQLIRASYRQVLEIQPLRPRAMYGWLRTWL